MSNNKRLILVAVLISGICGLCVLIGLLIYLPYREDQVRSQLVQTLVTNEMQEVIPTNQPTQVESIPLHREIPFESVVLISALILENGEYQEGWTGSGTFVSKDGLILTNAHVVLSDKNYKVDALTIAPTINPDEKPEPQFFAEVIQADAKLDLAVLRITTDLAGNPVDLAQLNFPLVKLGDSDSLSLGDRLTILGYPGIGGETITLTSGEVAGFSGESAYGNRAFIKTSATIAGGNSGGLAADSTGNLVGIPTQLGSGSEEDIVDCRTLADTNRDGVIDEYDSCVPTGGFINSLRPIKLALPLIQAAQRGEVNIIAETIPEAKPAPSPGGILFQDDFSNPQSGWTIHADLDGNVGYVNGEYQIHVTSPMMFISGTSGKTGSDVVLEVTARVVNPTSQGDFGLICRQQENGDYYAFEISEDGYASIWKNIQGNISTLVDWEYFYGIEGLEYVELAAICAGNQLGLAIDGQLLISTTDDDLREGDTGLIAGTWETSNMIVAFDDFSIRAVGR